jgi:hypothetical protein
MQSKCAVAIILFCLPAAYADLIPVTIALEEDGLNTPANLAAISTLESLIDPGGGANWTTEANNVLLGNMLNLVTTLGGDSAEIAQLFQPGAIFADVLEPTVPLISTFSLTQGSETPGVVPEPATIVLLAGALLFLSLYEINFHGPLLRSD